MISSERGWLKSRKDVHGLHFANSYVLDSKVVDCDKTRISRAYTDKYNAPRAKDEALAFSFIQHDESYKAIAIASRREIFPVASFGPHVQFC